MSNDYESASDWEKSKEKRWLGVENSQNVWDVLTFIHRLTSPPQKLYIVNWFFLVCLLGNSKVLQLELHAW